jgi:hypothetical protein
MISANKQKIQQIYYEIWTNWSLVMQFTRLMLGDGMIFLLPKKE